MEFAMRTIDVPRQDWTRTLDRFSAVHDGWLVSLEVIGPALGAQPQIRDLPLRGVTAEAATRDPVITIAAASPNGDEITHVVHAPQRVQIEQTNEGADVALQIQSGDGTSSILRFKTIALADSVDGMPRPA
jgi:hypothetical protein